MATINYKFGLIQNAWKKVDEIFPTDYEYDLQRSKRAGYDVCSSTAEDHYYDYICDLGDRLEVNLSNGDTVNVWYGCEDGEDMKASEPVEPESSIDTIHTLTVGLNDNDTLTQVIPTETAMTMIEDIICRANLGMTAWPCRGVFWDSEKHVKVIEPSIRIEICGATIEEVKAVMIDIKIALNQQCIMYRYQNLHTHIDTCEYFS